MIPEDFEDWLNQRMNWYADACVKAENKNQQTLMNNYGAKFDAFVEVFKKFQEMNEV